MFGFSKKKSAGELTKAELPTASGMSDVYVMPDKYIVKGSTGGNKGLIIVSVILLLVIAITGGYLAYDMISRQNATAEPTAEPPRIEIIEESAVQPEITETELEATTTEETVIPEAEEVATSTPEQAVSLQNSLDSDNDALTDVEETVFGTLPTNPDTDGDGYKDGIEVNNGYNPTKPGDSKLNESPFVISLTTDYGVDDFQVMYPKEWQSSVIKSGKQLLMTVTSGEVIKISVRDNQQGMSALAWYLQDHPDVMVSQLRLIETQDGQLSGFYTVDGLAAYLTDGSKTKFYVFEYLISRQTEIRYPNIFSMIIKSVKVLPQTIATVINNNANILMKSQCASNLNFCQLDPCGPLADGSNSCDSSQDGYCYEKECSSSSDCVAGKICRPLECYDGDTVLGIKLCK
jgi:hypothetical protein